MSKAKITVVGIGPGSKDDITPAVMNAVKEADVVVGYKYYFQFIEPYLKEGAQCVDTGMKRERDRARQAFEYAEQGNSVVVISSGDASVYGMTPLIWEMAREKEDGREKQEARSKKQETTNEKQEARGKRQEISNEKQEARGKKQEMSDESVIIECHPGISAFQKAATLLGAPIGHDFCAISLSDLMTPWATIERRIIAAAEADFVTAVYNPKSHGRYWQLSRLKELFLKARRGDTPVGYVRQAGRPEQEIKLTTLQDLNPEDIDMFTVLIIGNSQSYAWRDKMITPRGYYRDSAADGENAEDGRNVGQSIMMESFRTISSELRNPEIPLSRKWPLLHAIHTTADFDMEKWLYTDEDAVPVLHQAMVEGRLNTIITDVTMAASGIRKVACERYGIEVKCYLHDSRVAEMAKELNITRSQAGIRLAVMEHPDALFVFGNAPTALMELCDLMRKGKACPAGVVAAPVGFVHVCESKWMVKSFVSVPKLIIEGRKGGSNIAATLVNSILAWEDAEQLKPGRDV